MQTIKSKINTKYRLLEYDDEKLHNYLQNEKNYHEFMQTLSNILITQLNYDIYIFDRSDFIKNEIEIHNKGSEIPIYEKFIQKKLQYIESFSDKDKDDLRSQYAYFYTASIRVPYKLRDERLLPKLIRENYENFQKMETVIENDDEELKETLKGNLSSLITVNSILYENATVDEDLISLFNEIAKVTINREDFKDNLSYLYCKMYQYSTAKNLKEFKTKQIKVKSKTFC